jgi:hypothetical protein
MYIDFLVIEDERSMKQGKGKGSVIRMRRSEGRGRRENG